VPETTVAAQIHQAFDAHGYLPTKIAFDRIPADFSAERFHLFFGQVLDFRVWRNLGSVANHACAG
jgi:hypothetical protein